MGYFCQRKPLASKHSAFDTQLASLWVVTCGPLCWQSFEGFQSSLNNLNAVMVQPRLGTAHAVHWMHGLALQNFTQKNPTFKFRPKTVHTVLGALLCLGYHNKLDCVGATTQSVNYCLQQSAFQRYKLAFAQTMRHYHPQHLTLC